MPDKAAPVKMQWQYWVQDQPMGHPQEEQITWLDARGRESWELIAVFPIHGPTASILRCIFKRESV